MTPAKLPNPLHETADRAKSSHAQVTETTVHYGGVVAAVVTPCQSAGIVDTNAMSRLCQMLSQHGCNGLFVGGSTGELPLLDEDDRRAIITTAREAVSADIKIYAGVTGTGIKQTIRYARYAAADGADAAVVMAPFFLKLSQMELVRYFLDIADNSPIPIVLYHHPRAASSLEPETIATAGNHPNIVAIKDTSSDLRRIQSVMEVAAPTQLCVLQGSEPLILESLRLGATGMVSALANVAPEWHAALYMAARTGRDAQADQLQQRISELWNIFQLEPVRTSIAAFTYLLKISVRRRGWLANTSGIVPGFEPTNHFRRAILKHLENCEVPVAVST